MLKNANAGAGNTGGATGEHDGQSVPHQSTPPSHPRHSHLSPSARRRLRTLELDRLGPAFETCGGKIVITPTCPIKIVVDGYSFTIAPRGRGEA